MKKIVIALILGIAALFVPASSYGVKPLYAQTNLQPGVCVSVYGGGVVCGAKHEVVPTALGDVNPALMGAGFLFASGVFVYLSKKVKRGSSQIIG